MNNTTAHAARTPERSPRAAHAVHSIDHYALAVPDLAVARHFHEAFGLRVEADGDGLNLYAADGHRWARCVPGPARSLAYLSLNCYAADFDGLVAQAMAAGARPASAASTDADGLWFFDLDGHLIQLRTGPKTSPDTKLAAHDNSSPANVRGALTRSEVSTVQPRRLSHVLLFTPDVARAVAFYNAALGLRLSDRSLDLIAFTHAPHGSDHHLLAFAKSSARGWHHAAWDVPGVNDVGQGAAQMAAAGYAEGWGTGRHVLGSNYFHYVRDPWGSFCEYSADIDFVPAGADWDGGAYAPEDSLYQWGPPVPANFIVNSEAVSGL